MHVGIEVGGTFTDLILIDDSGGIVATTKVLSTPVDPADGVLHALAQVRTLLDSEIPLYHGSTVATNAVLERSGPQIGLLVTSGFKDLLEIQRQDRTSIYDLHYRKPQPLVPPAWVREIPERIDAAGTIIHSLDLETVEQAAAELVAGGVTSIAVCFLHSYRNPVHEREVKDRLALLVPDTNISISSDIMFEFREYERASTTTIDAYVKPVVDRYLGHLERSAAASGISSVWMMQSNGGLLPASYIKEQPVRTLFSGPAAGVIGACTFARAARFENIITMDMGGTSTDVCLVTSGDPEVTTEASIDGIPINVPMLDIVSVGAGGGSIAWLDSGEMLQIGPESAGASPGPACYGLGGTRPTMTDANVVRGLIRPGHFLGGQLQLDRDAALAALDELAVQTGREHEQLAEDIYRVANATMANVIQLISTERGFDPRDYTLIAYGGAGPLHAAAVAEELAISRVLAPPHPGLISAYGLLSGDIQRDFSRTLIQPLAELDLTTIRERISVLTTHALAEMGGQGIDLDYCRTTVGIDLRYRGQGFELTVPVDPNELTVNSLEDAFHRLHRERFGHATPGEPIEVVTYRIVVVQPHEHIAELRVQPEVRETETVPLVIGGEPVPCLFAWRGSLKKTTRLAGPAIIEEPTATTFVPPGWVMSVDQHSNLVLEREDNRS